MIWRVSDDIVKCKGICIASNTVQTAKTFGNDTIVFLLTETSNYSFSLNQKYLDGKPYKILEDVVVEKMVEEYCKYLSNTNTVDDSILLVSGITNKFAPCYDERINKLIVYIKSLNTIEKSIVDDLSSYIFLSKSRMSHLFKQETGMTLHSYLAFEKLHKAFYYFTCGKNITDSCMLAGFDSPSHFSATCQRMFGISLSDVYKTIATK